MTGGVLDLAAALGHIPAAPTSLAVSASGGQAVLTWTDNSHAEHNFEFKRETWDGSAWTSTIFNDDLPINGDSTGSHTDSPGTGRHRYRIRAINSVGDSAWSNTVEITL